jgi:hypothetical protein
VVTPYATCESEALLVLHVIVAPDPLTPLAVTPEIVSGTANAIADVLDEPLNEAVTVALSSATNALAVAKNVPLTEPAGIVTEAGTVRFAELELRPMVPPPDPVSITVQVLDALGPIVLGLHAKELMVFTEDTETVPPVLAIASASPAGEAPRLLATVIGAAPLPDSVTDTLATIPL